jgi:hypothetical protein
VKRFGLPGIVAAGVIVTLLAAACRGEEARARGILEANTEGIEQCEQMGHEATASLEETFDAMQEGRWTEAEGMLHSDAQPSVEAFGECMEREQAILFAKLSEAGISDEVARRVAQKWWDERRARIEAEEAAGP